MKENVSKDTHKKPSQPQQSQDNIKDPNRQMNSDPKRRDGAGWPSGQPQQGNPSLND